MNGIDDVIRQLERQKSAIEKALEALRAVGGEVSGGAAPSTPAESANDRRSAGQKARWAAKKAAQDAPVAPPAKAARKGGMTPEGRKRLAEAMKRRWAVKRTAAQAKKRPGRRKKAA